MPFSANADPLALEEQVCFVLAATNRAILAVYRPLLEPLGLTHPQYLVMLVLWDHLNSEAARPLSVKEIAAALQLDSATLSPMLKRLDSIGLVTRTRSAADERLTEVELTSEGITLRQRALGVPATVVERLGVSIDELDVARDVLIRLNAAALAAGDLEEKANSR